jgi:pyridoxamine 5'-phosphate oxidase
MKEPYDLLIQWLAEERERGAPHPQQAVLSTAALNARPSARVVAIREINEQGLLFFTQRSTRKVQELLKNPLAVVTFWFELLRREVIIEGIVESLSKKKMNSIGEAIRAKISFVLPVMRPLLLSQLPVKRCWKIEKRRLNKNSKIKNYPLALFIAVLG